MTAAPLPYTTLFRSDRRSAGGRTPRAFRGLLPRGAAVASPPGTRSPPSAGAPRRPDDSRREGNGFLVETPPPLLDRKSTRLNSSHEWISDAIFCLKK